MIGEIWEQDGPLCVVAGPGTGKTYTLAKRIKFLVEEKNVSPAQVTVITFTKAAAQNMRRRLCDSQDKATFVDPDMQPPIISTMHSLADRIIKERLSALGYSTERPVLLPNSIRTVLMEDAARVNSYGLEEMKETVQCRTTGLCDPQDQPKCQICDTYQSILKKTNAIDHDEQIILGCRLLAEDSSLCDEFAEKCTHLLVDEYQDINAGQFRLINSLTCKNPTGLFVVGDDDQSIYSWRGATPDYIRKFGEHFGESASTHTLNKSWRCNENILEAALCVVKEFDKERQQKPKFEYEDGAGDRIVVHNVPSDERETKILTALVSRESAVSDVLVLVPNYVFAEEISIALSSAGISVNRQTSRPGEGVLILANLACWLQCDQDSLALRMCLQHILDNRGQSGVPGKRSKNEDKRAERQNALAEISALWQSVLDDNSLHLWGALENNYESSALLTTCFTHLNTLRSAFKEKKPTSIQMQQAICAFEPWVTSEQQQGDAAKMFKELIGWASLLDQKMTTDTANVRVMTLESSKGLEARTVCIVGCEEITMPGPVSSDEALAEKARLMFVAMTRAKSALHIFCARKRSSAKVFRAVYLKGSPPSKGPSRFLDVLPRDCVTKQWHPSKSASKAR